ncbi:cobyric acid synthase [Clostridium aminobutyricum]|uniref:Cobyric acid synthase n=1 Tax=Clostridium aminobutyricum TaxID=33953 RepID=A0A939D7B1_CLOAM|nr:cobyric acid synthase [Clostridium aminobutyricum]MBN7772400.1 cobyric acid synthase [Clostridium aminobutyricum]
MAKAIMVQGTMSNAGKSLLVAGLCRLFKQDGYRVAPFKSQNMALNSFITREGLEMGRAQVVQAEAAGIEPSVLMNPILLKPTNDMASQVIVNGEVYRNMNAKEYYQHKREMVPEIKKAYDTLASQYDIIVLEGAGSPAEINLRDNDIVNMFMAKLAQAPVLLAGDIDRGGVFASLVGTMMLFTEEERAMVKGTIINKFRGDKTILQPGLDLLEEMIQVPTVGVVPYLHVDIDDEDSLTDRFKRKSEIGLIDIAVIRLPRISNFTDFNVFEYAQSVTLRYVDSASELGNPDLIIIPGTKNTMEDLLWMRQCGLEAAVIKHAASGKPLFGICGGFQMLGQELSDPYHVEHGGSMKGLGLLPAKTVFEKEKTRTRVKGHFSTNGQGYFAGLDGVSLEGYEIHMGQTILLESSDSSEVNPLTGLSELIQEDGGEEPAGMFRDNVYGSYVHGIFDSEDVVKTIVAILLRKKGLDESSIAGLDVKAYKERQYDLLAEGLRNSMDMEAVYRILNDGINK